MIMAPPAGWRRFLPKALACVTAALLCSAWGLSQNDALSSGAFLQSLPICRSGAGADVLTQLGAGLGMGLTMMLVSLVPLRWGALWSWAGAATALSWIVAVGTLHAAVIAGEALVRTLGMPLLDPLLRLTVLAFCMAGALTVTNVQPKPGAAQTVPTLRMGLTCLVRCGPMITAMMLTGAMSIAWMIAGALVTQAEEAIADRVVSRSLVWIIGSAGIAAIAATY